jgi:hypothetical protein
MSTASIRMVVSLAVLDAISRLPLARHLIYVALFASIKGADLTAGSLTVLPSADTMSVSFDS